MAVCDYLCCVDFSSVTTNSVRLIIQAHQSGDVGRHMVHYSA